MNGKFLGTHYHDAQANKKSFEFEPRSHRHFVDCRDLKRPKASLPSTPPKQVTRIPSLKYYSRRKRLSSNPGLQLPSPIERENSVSSSAESSDLESLPDLSDDKETPFSSPVFNPLTPENSYFSFPKRVEDRKVFSFSVEKPAKTLIFDIPEIVYKVVEYADLMYTAVPQEETPIRRRPLSYRHALMVYGDEKRAQESLKIRESHPPQLSGVLYTCLQINRLFNQVTQEIMNKKMFFQLDAKFASFVSAVDKCDSKLKPSMIVLHKLFLTRQAQLDRIATTNIDFSRVECLEFYMCPKLSPQFDFGNNGHKLKKVVITGSKRLDDRLVETIATNCPNLEHLDLRACEFVSDSGIYSVAANCCKLTTINFGRKTRGHLITDASICPLVRNNSSLNTIGLAGCHITDRAVWDIALSCNSSLHRLSLNNCKNLTDQSIPLILHANYLPNLSVLELRYADNITNFKPVIEFKRRQEFKGVSILVEVCEALCTKMRLQEFEMDKVISQRIFNDILAFANNSNDDDTPYQSFLLSRQLSRNHSVSSTSLASTRSATQNLHLNN